jgi:hypothetical protein
VFAFISMVHHVLVCLDHSSGKMLIMVLFEVVLVLYIASYDFP